MVLRSEQYVQIMSIWWLLMPWLLQSPGHHQARYWLCKIGRSLSQLLVTDIQHDDVIKWKYFPCYWPFARGINRSPVNSLHKGQWRRALMLSLICDWTNSWANNRDASDLRRHCAYYDVIVINAFFRCGVVWIFVFVFSCSPTSFIRKENDGGHVEWKRALYIGTSECGPCPQWWTIGTTCAHLMSKCDRKCKDTFMVFFRKKYSTSRGYMYK